MNYFLLAETEFFRRINEAGDCNMEKAYTAFATQVIELCNGGMDMNLTVIALAYIEIELQHHPVRNLSEERREIAAYVSKALSFVRKMQKFLATLAYNVGPYRLLGSGKIPKSTLIRKLEAGDRNIYREYIAFCNYKGKRHAMLLKRRKAEFALLYAP